ncbi:MAG: dehydrogenase [Phycisphaerales bacterium]|nr:dehydrogenase [Phycisphaerales bacterium]
MALHPRWAVNFIRCPNLVKSATDPLDATKTSRRGTLRVPQRTICTVTVLTLCAAAAALFAGSPGGELAQQKPKYHIKEIPPAPVRTADEELKTFKLPPGFRIELVASDPMVEEPIALTFDPDGRIYVVELRAYMPDMQGTGELDPIGRIVRLEDTDGDGKPDKRTVFLDKLSIPRAVSLAGDGVLVAEPPNVWFCRDTNGDGVCDEKTAVFTDFGSKNPNPEHMANGLTWTLDNWYYNADWAARFRFSKGKFLRDGVAARGQWGIAQDDVGRLFYNSNSSMLRCDLVPAQYLTRNPYFASPPGANVAIAKNNVYPNRVNPGVNRGYTEDVNLEGKLQRVTASCGPTIYRGDQFPVEFRGNAFVCEPAGNLISRQVLSQNGLNISAKSVQHDGVDFLTSTDERFRPVSTYTGPDGALYVVDLYHGILQHRAYLSAYLQDQVKRRDLDKNNGHHGRIWRIVHESAKPTPQPRLAKASSDQLAQHLLNANGWWRDTSQRLLVERQDAAVVPALERIVGGETPGVTPLAKVHALYTLQGIDKLDDDVLAGAIKDADPRVRVAAMRVGEVLVRKHIGSAIVEAIQGLTQDADPSVQLQVLVMASPDVPELVPTGNKILAAHLTDPLFRSAAIAGAAGRELEVLQSLLTDKAFAASAPGQSELLNDLAECVIRGRSPDRIEKLFELVASQAKTREEAMLAGIVEAVAPPSSNGKGKPVVTPRRLRLLRAPAGLATLHKSSDRKVIDLAKKAEEGLSWPGKPGDNTPPLTPLSAEQQQSFTAGRETFGQICAQCHQPSGLGQEGVAPPLVDSEWVLGPPDRLARIALNGVHGPIKVGKKTSDLEMPGLYALPDDQIASVLTYVRREWGHEGTPVSIDLVAKVRKASADRGQTQWTADELLQIK